MRTLLLFLVFFVLLIASVMIEPMILFGFIALVLIVLAGWLALHLLALFSLLPGFLLSLPSIGALFSLFGGGDDCGL